MRILRPCRIVFNFFILVGCITAATPFSVIAGTGPSLAILPLTVHAGQDLSYLADGAADMLGSRIAAGTGALILDRDRVNAAMVEEGRPINPAVAESVAGAIGADYVLFGSITRLGRAFSLDINMIDMSGENEPAVFYRQADSIDDLIPAINAVAEAVSVSVLGAAETSASSPTGSSALSNDPAAAGDGNGPFIRRPDDGRASDFWKSRDFEMEIRGLAVADFSGDGKNEIVLLADNYLCVRRLEQDRFYKLAEYQAARHEQFLTVGAADTDGNGKAEIFVSAINMNSGQAASLVLELSSGRLTEVARRQEWLLRTMGEEGRIFGQKKGRPDAFIDDVSMIFPPGIWRLQREGTEYVPQERIQVPDNFSLFAVSRGAVRDPHSADYIVADYDERLRLYDDTGRLLWTSHDHFAGTETYLSTREEGDNEIGKRVYLPQRVLITGIGPAKRKEVITVSHTPAAGRLFSRFRRYRQSSFVGLTWDGLGLIEEWRTSPVSGYIADFDLADLNNDGRRELVGGVVMSRTSVFSKPRSCVVRYTLDNTD